MGGKAMFHRAVKLERGGIVSVTPTDDNLVRIAVNDTVVYATREEAREVLQLLERLRT